MADHEVSIARLVTVGPPPNRPEFLCELIEGALRTAWPQGTRAKFLLLPGGALTLPWPEQVTAVESFTRSEWTIVSRYLRSWLPQLLSRKFIRTCKGCADVVVLGVDIRDAVTGAYAELIATVETSNGSITAITGKSLRRSDQRRLVTVPSLGTHLTRVAGERVLLLGCHDLNFFSPRGRKRQRVGGARHLLREDMDRRVAAFKPTVALQLPHGTDTSRTWTHAWSALKRATPSLRTWASGISFYRVGANLQARSSIGDVLTGTCGGEPTLDVVLGNQKRRQRRSAPSRSR